MQRTFTKHTEAIGSRASVNTCLTYTKKESWSAPWRYPNTWIVIGVIGVTGVGLQTQKSEKLHASKGVGRGIYDLFILAAWNKLEDVDGLPFVTASTTSLPFIHVRHDRHVGNQTVCNEDDHVNSFLPGTSSGWEEPKRDQEELQCHRPENHWKAWKSTENHALPRTWKVL